MTDLTRNGRFVCLVCICNCYANAVPVSVYISSLTLVDTLKSDREFRVFSPLLTRSSSQRVERHAENIEFIDGAIYKSRITNVK